MNIAFIGMSGNLLNFGKDSRGTIKRRCEREDSDEERESRGRGEIETVKNAGTCGTRHLLNCAISETPGRVIRPRVQPHAHARQSKRFARAKEREREREISSV